MLLSCSEPSVAGGRPAQLHAALAPLSGSCVGLKPWKQWFLQVVRKMLCTLLYPLTVRFLVCKEWKIIPASRGGCEGQVHMKPSQQLAHT